MSASASGDVLVSVVLPYLRAEQTLDRALRSVLSQTLRNLEVIAVSDGSTDDSQRIVAEHERRDPRVRSLVLPTNVGPAAARNRGIDHAVGQWIAVLDADDWFADDRLERLLAAAGDASLVVDNLMGVDPADGTLIGKVFPTMPRTLSFEQIVAPYAEGSQYNFGYLKPMFRKSFLDRHGLRYDEGLRTAEDLVLLLECSAEAESIRAIGEAGYFYSLQQSPTKRKLSRTTHSVPNDREVIRALDRVKAERASVLSPEAKAALQQRKKFLEQIADVSSFRHAFLRGRFAYATWFLFASPRVRAYLLNKLQRRVFRLFGNEST